VDVGVLISFEGISSGVSWALCGEACGTGSLSRLLRVVSVMTILAVKRKTRRVWEAECYRELAKRRGGSYIGRMFGIRRPCCVLPREGSGHHDSLQESHPVRHPHSGRCMVEASHAKNKYNDPRLPRSKHKMKASRIRVSPVRSPMQAHDWRFP
jgi:hypothetical protein